MMKRFAVLFMSVMLLATMAAAQGRGHGRGHGNHGDDDDEDSYSQGGRGSIVFTQSDRIRISDCLTSNREGLPPGLAKRDSLPPGLQKQLQRNGHLPPGLEKKMRPMPRACEVQLPRLPSNYARVIVGNYVILKDIHDRIIDLIDLNRRR